MSASIRDRLMERGQKSFNAPQQLIQCAKIVEAEALLNGLENFVNRNGIFKLLLA